MRRPFFCVVVLAAILLLLLIPFESPSSTYEPPSPRHRYYGRVIAIDPTAPHATALAHAAERWLGVLPTTPVRAVNGTEAMQLPTVPLYTRMTLRGGRHDHMQMGHPAMLGCLLSHIALWREFAASSSSDGVLLVLEEDALLDALSAERLHALLAEQEEESWDLLMLETGHITVSGPTRSVGRWAMTWDIQKDNRSLCAWMGTRGYLLRPDGARTLLRHADELSVQVDALMGLVATFEPQFRMLWPRANVAHPRFPLFLSPLTTTVQHDVCVKCYLPRSPWVYVLVIISALLASIPHHLLQHAKPSKAG